MLRTFLIPKFFFVLFLKQPAILKESQKIVYQYKHNPLLYKTVQKNLNWTSAQTTTKFLCFFLTLHQGNDKGKGNSKRNSKDKYKDLGKGKNKGKYQGKDKGKDQDKDKSKDKGKNNGKDKGKGKDTRSQRLTF